MVGNAPSACFPAIKSRAKQIVSKKEMLCSIFFSIGNEQPFVPTWPSPEREAARLGYVAGRSAPPPTEQSHGKYPRRLPGSGGNFATMVDAYLPPRLFRRARRERLPSPQPRPQNPLSIGEVALLPLTELRSAANRGIAEA